MHSQKACSICGKSYASDEYTYRDRSNRSYCRACDRTDARLRREGGAERVAEWRDAMRQTWRASPDGSGSRS